MALSCQSMFEAAQSEFGFGLDSEKGQLDFKNAVNRSLDELSLEADLATRHSHITAQDDSVSTLDEEYEPIVYAGVRYHMARMGNIAKQPVLARFILEETSREWDRMRGEYVVALDNDDQATDSNSMTKLGYLG